MAKHKVKRYDDGGDIDINAEMGDKYSSQAKDIATTKDAAPTEDAAPAPKTFKEAFASARADGDKTFMFNGKSYTTELASSKPTTPASAKTSAPKAEPKTKSAPASVSASKDSDREGGIGPYKMFSKAKTTEEGLAKMRAKDEAQRASFVSPLENLSGIAKKLREKAGITSYKKGGMTASSRGDGIAKRGHTRGKLC